MDPNTKLKYLSHKIHQITEFNSSQEIQQIVFQLNQVKSEIPQNSFQTLQFTYILKSICGLTHDCLISSRLRSYECIDIFVSLLLQNEHDCFTILNNILCDHTETIGCLEHYFTLLFQDQFLPLSPCNSLLASCAATSSCDSLLQIILKSIDLNYKSDQNSEASALGQAAKALHHFLRHHHSFYQKIDVRHLVPLASVTNFYKKSSQVVYYFHFSKSDSNDVQNLQEAFRILSERAYILTLTASENESELDELYEFCAKLVEVFGQGAAEMYATRIGFCSLDKNYSAYLCLYECVNVGEEKVKQMVLSDENVRDIGSKARKLQANWGDNEADWEFVGEVVAMVEGMMRQ